MKKCEHDLIEDECFQCLRATVAELAAEAVKLNAKISYLRAKNDKLESDLRSMGDRKDNAEARAVALSVKMARYRAALEQIIDLNSGSFPLPWDTQRVAREALNQ